MYESVGDESPNISAAIRQHIPHYNRTVVADGDESKTKQKFDVLLLAEHKRANRVNNHQHSQYCDDNGRNVEERFALHEQIRWDKTELRRFATPSQGAFM
jgi:hypothetical protein